MQKGFSQRAKESLGYYVYALVDPRDNTIFYIGKGKDNRIFQHAEDALNEDDKSLKLDTIREIINGGKEVSLYILRHNLGEKTAYAVESALIDLLTYKKFNTSHILTNIAAGHHQWDEGIKGVNEIELIYDCPKIEFNEGETLLLVSLNNSFNQNKAKGVFSRPDIYEATRKYWKLNKKKVKDIKYVLGVYKGIVRSVLEVQSLEWTNISDDGTIFGSERCIFTGRLLEENETSYLNKDVTDYPFGSGGAVRYI